METWRDIKGYEGLYQVSNEGRVKSLDRTVKSWWGTQFVAGRLLKPHTNKRGYSQVALCKNGKISVKLVHRLVAEAFIPNLDNKPCIDHIVPLRDGGTNHVENLHWCTYKENINNPKTIKIMVEWANSDKNKKRVSEQFKGNKNPNFYKKGKPNLALSKKIYVYKNGELVGEYISASEAARQLGLNQGSISKCCNGGFLDYKKNKWINYTQYKGYNFSYEPL